MTNKQRKLIALSNDEIIMLKDVLYCINEFNPHDNRGELVQQTRDKFRNFINKIEHEAQD